MEYEIRSLRAGVIGRGTGWRELGDSSVLRFEIELMGGVEPVGSLDGSAGVRPIPVIKEQQAIKKIRMGICRWKADRLGLALAL